MTRVITYGTFDHLHYGHIRLLERAKALGDYLIVGVTSDDFDFSRGKINVSESVDERVAAVQALGIADKVIIEEYEGQKIDDIRKYNVDIFTVGSDWKGHFDYLNDYCKVVYLDRTKGISSTQIRSDERSISLGVYGNYDRVLRKFVKESSFVNGVHIKGVCTDNPKTKQLLEDIPFYETYEELLQECQAVYICSSPQYHYRDIKKALDKGKHVLCESPISLNEEECKELFQFAKDKELILMDAVKTGYAMAFNRLLLLARGFRLGKIVSIDATCTSLSDPDSIKYGWNSISSWGPVALLPVFEILGDQYNEAQIISIPYNENNKQDALTKISFVYENAIADVKVGTGFKSEGDLVISGTQGYIYVPAPWWKTDYFEIRYENPEENRKQFYPLSGEGIRYMIVVFLSSIEKKKSISYLTEKYSISVSKVLQRFYQDKDVIDTKPLSYTDK